ncbi:MAG TPA: ABC transporter permease [Thermoanaerobaculia bacterium]|nr:ABC transporter permease [Thermoanaerobaculia bacterium]
MSQMMQDVRVTARSLFRQPGFALAAILTLGLAIGANTAIFSVVDAVLLQVPPFKDPDRVMMVWAVKPEIAKLIGSDDLPASSANLYDFQEEGSAFESLALATADRQALTGQGEPEQLGTILVTPDFFKVLGTPALIGRTLGAEDETPGTPLATVLSYDFWQRRFGGDRSVVGKTFIMNGKPLNVVGVMPRRFAFPRGSEVPSYLGFPVNPDVWVPQAHTPEAREDRGNRVSFMIGKLKPGASPAAAEQELNAICTRIAEEVHARSKGWSVRLVPIIQQMSQGLRPVLLVLWAAGAMVLLIACVNVANLLLARSASRQKEIALRTAIGAGRQRIIGQLLMESGILSLLGGALGVFLAWTFLKLCAANIPAGLVGAATFALEPRALAFTLLACVITSLLAGLFPAFQMTRPDLAGMLREGTRAGAGTTQSRRTRSALVVAEVAIAVVVLIGAGLLLRSFNRLMDIDPGFRTENVLTFKVDLPSDRPADELASFFTRLDQELNSMPGAKSAALISDLPMGGADGLTTIIIEGKPEPKPGEMLIVGARMATPGYFETLDIALRKGRLLQAGDTRNAAMAAVIDDAMAEAYWPGEEVVGRRFKRRDTKDSPWITVVGVVENLRHSDLYSEPRPTLFMTPDQVTKFFMPYQASAVVRTEGDPLALSTSVRNAVYAVDRNQPVAQVRPLEEVVSQSITKSRLSLLLLTLLSILALTLAMVGIYGITSYTVAQRRREIGLRMALGAQREQVLRLVVRETGLLAILGIALGVGLALVLTRVGASYISALLYDVTSTDPMTFVGVAVALALVALGAAYFPGRGATRVSPMTALRTD